MAADSAAPSRDKPVRLVSLHMTCSACPSQWEGATLDGRAFYARYRGGWFSAGVGATVEDAVTATWNESEPGTMPVLSCEWGEPLDGVMSTEEMLELLDGRVVIVSGGNAPAPRRPPSAAEQDALDELLPGPGEPLPG